MGFFTRNLKYNITNGLVGWWTMDSANIFGNSVFDMSGNNNHGTSANTPSIVAGKIQGQAISFNGSSDYVSVPDSSIIDSPSSAITIAAWILTNSTARQRIVIKPYDQGFNKSYQMEIGNDSLPGSVTISLTTDAGGGNLGDPQWETGAGAISTGSWTHLAVTWVNTNGDSTDAKIYVNAVSQTGLTYTNSGFYGAGQNLKYDSVVLPLHIGNGNDRVPDNHYFNGMIDDVRVYNRALSQTEITSLYNYNG